MLQIFDCCSVSKLLLGAETSEPQATTAGTVLIESPVPLHVTVSYTMVTGEGAGASIDVEVIEPQRITVQEPVRRPLLPARPARPVPRTTPPRPQDVPRSSNRQETRRQGDRERELQSERCLKQMILA